MAASTWTFNTIWTNNSTGAVTTPWIDARNCKNVLIQLCGNGGTWTGTMNVEVSVDGVHSSVATPLLGSAQPTSVPTIGAMVLLGPTPYFRLNKLTNTALALDAIAYGFGDSNQKQGTLI